MKKILFSLLLLVGQVPILLAQYAPAPRDPNKKADLEHHVVVSANDSDLQKNIIDGLTKWLGKQDLAIKVDDELGKYPDMILIADGDKSVLDRIECQDCICVQLKFKNQKELENCQVISVCNIKNAIKKTGKFLKKYYYSGLRPTCSTVFSSRKEGYVNYRIPSVVTLPCGRILAITEARGEGRTDCAENDLVVKYSDNEGKTWSKPILMAESGHSSLNNPVSVYIEELGRILVLFQEYPPKTNEGSVQSGLEGDRINRFYSIYSDDQGETWSQKKDITIQAKQPKATGYACGPGGAIRVVSGPDKGRIIVPVNVSGGCDGWYNYLIASDDLGETWHILPGRSSYGTNESQIVQISDTEFIINARCHRYEGDDLNAPKGWNPWNFSKVTHYRGEIPLRIEGNNCEWGETVIRKDLPDPLCQGCIYRYSGLCKNEKSRILFVNPASMLTYGDENNYYRIPPRRMNGVIRISYDEGKTWKWSKRIFGNRFTEFQYSTLTRLPSGHIGCFFEASENLCFVVFDMKWLTSGTDSGK